MSYVSCGGPVGTKLYFKYIHLYTPNGNSHVHNSITLSFGNDLLCSKFGVGVFAAKQPPLFYEQISKDMVKT